MILILDSAEGPLEIGAVNSLDGTVVSRWRGSAAGSTVEDLEEGLSAVISGIAEAGGDGKPILGNRFQKCPFQAIVIAQGPGSFTGLRIGYAFATGLASVWGIPVIEVPSLDAYAASSRSIASGLRTRVPNALSEEQTPWWGIVVSDARRGEWFTKYFWWSGNKLLGDDEPVIRSMHEIKILLRNGFRDRNGKASKAIDGEELASANLMAPMIITPGDLLPLALLVENEADEGESSASKEVFALQLHRVPCRITAICSWIITRQPFGASACPVESPSRMLAALQPLYVRSVAAKTIEERDRDKDIG